MKRIVTLLLSILLLVGAAQAQAQSDRLVKISAELREKIGKEFQGWSQRTIKPIEGSENVSIEQWESGDMIIKVAITEYKAKDDAIKALKDFRFHLTTEENAKKARGKTDFRLVKDELPALGDGGFIWDFLGSEAAAFRRENYLVFVSIPRRPQGYSESRLSRLFAERVADVIAQ